MAKQSDTLQDLLSGSKRDNLATIIDRLAGDKDNLKVNLKNVKFTLRGEKFDINGVVEFKVFHKIPNAHAVAKEVVEKYG
ncbi:hypothetical protein GX563_00315 [Candidatus Bathyarchaeota archaeon]|nr:hypothetical protein [Candidatus Bathyarchaeota archaeon]